MKNNFLSQLSPFKKGKTVEMEKFKEAVPAQATKGRYLIISDSHGSKKNLLQILEKEPLVTSVIFLGDGLGDITQAKVLYPHLDFDVVRGNCDINGGAAPMQVLSLCNLKVFICHGDGFDVKMSLLALRRVAISMGASVALYGHTHKQYYEYLDGLYLFCPGSVDRDIPTSFKICYGIMEIENATPVFYHRELD